MEEYWLKPSPRIKDVSRTVPPCQEYGCDNIAPTCCLDSLICTGSQYTTRWYHLSRLEHFCKSCFDDYHCTSGSTRKIFSLWTLHWLSVSCVTKPNFKRFVLEELLPYWVKCNVQDCGKYRKVQAREALTPQFIENFTCKANKESCDLAECSDVYKVLNSKQWMQPFSDTPLLKNCVAKPYLGNYFSEEIGLSPAGKSVSKFIISDSSLFTLQDYVKPFCKSQFGKSTIWMNPFQMEEDEADFMSQSFLPAPIYLGVRNLIITLWNLSPREWLIPTRVYKYIIFRGLTRIYVLSQVEKIIDYLTSRAVINYGIVNSLLSRYFATMSVNSKHSILIVGSGISGLVAAKHLHNSGFRVIVLEAQSKPGGRLNDLTFNTETHIIRGLINNPITIMAMQANADIKEFKQHVTVFKENGEVVDPDEENKIMTYFNGILHGALEWAVEFKSDAEWYDTIIKNKEEFKKIASITDDEDKLFNFYLTANEVELGLSMKNTTLQNWKFPSSLEGEDGIITSGFGPILDKLAENVDIRFNNEVTSINYSNEDAIAVSTTREQFEVSKVLLAVPLSALSNENIKFLPSLPEDKQNAIKNLDYSFCDKVIMRFSKNFWSSKLQGSSKFCIISEDNTLKYYIDVSNEQHGSVYSLMTFITEHNASLMINLNDESILKMCMCDLRKIFDSKIVKVPEPIDSFITHSKDEKFGGSYGSFIKVGGKSNAFDILAKSVDKKLYFSGEACFKACPGTVTGACLSGLEQAANIIKDYNVFED